MDRGPLPDADRRPDVLPVALRRLPLVVAIAGLSYVSCYTRAKRFDQHRAADAFREQHSWTIDAANLVNASVSRSAPATTLGVVS